MSPTVRVLVVDDDDLMLDELVRLFEGDGYTVVGVSTRDDAMTRLADEDWHLVVLDQKLRGAQGPDEGLELIDQARIHVPGAKIIVISGFANAQSITRAFDAGVDDFIEKRGAFGEILRQKARQSIESVRDRRLLALRSDAREQQLAERWQAAQAETDRLKKGPLLEETIKLLLQTMPGWSSIRSNVSNEIEEIDLLVRNESTDPFWSRQSDYLLVECKNWSSHVGSPEFDRFYGKMTRRYGRCRLGLLIALGGFANTVKLDALSRREGEHLVILLNRSDVDRLVQSPADSRLACLKSFYDRAIVSVNGTH